MDQPYESACDASGNYLSRYMLETVRKDDEFVLYRGRTEPELATILVAEPVSEYPTPATIRKLEHEYSLRNELHTDWATRPMALTRHKGRPRLVLEDPGGEPLDTLLGSPMELSRFLRLAIGLSSTLGKLHARGVIHKDIKPANVLVNDAKGQVWLTGFGIASQLRRERQSPEPPEFIAGTLAYMAPEQTGRMNRSVDSRCDLYALGVTLYELLTGHLPFTASEPMEWVHCHVARSPLSPSERRKDIPSILSSIVMKLLAKTVEERYQTATGVENDLQLCLAAFETHHRFDDFPLGTHDIPDRLLIPEKLYGREREIEILLACFDRVVEAGSPELVLISGYSGIGKSSVVNELHRVLVPRGVFASGKFDQYKRDIPYSTLAQAFQSLIRGLLFKSDSELTRWRDALLEALDPNARLIVDLVPELKLIIGDQPPVPELEPQQAQSRFQLVFRRFIGVFARPEHPLALFVDDLQWIDSATLDLLEDLLTRSDLRHLMLIGANRDNEVTPTHPLIRKLEAIKKAGGKVTEITLAPLARQHLGQLIVDALLCERERAAPLAQLIHERTGGNPFFTIQFISALVEERMLIFDHDATRWTWEFDRIHAKGYTDNVVDLMVAKVTRLPVETQNALRQLACLGNVAAITTISIVLGKSDEQIHATLWPAVRQELVERLPGAYRFVHDRIQEAAYTTVPEELRGETHLRIGRLLAAQIPPEKREEAIFDIVNQLNRGADLIDSQDEREQLAEFNLIAGRRAKASTAYASALKYLITGAALLADDCWARLSKLAMAFELLRAECEFLTGELTQASDRLTALSAHVVEIGDLATVVSLHIQVCTTLDQHDRAVALCLDYLRHLGMEWFPHPAEEEVRREYERFWLKLGDGAIEDLVDLPRMTDPIALATMDVLTSVVLPAGQMDRKLFVLVACRAANLCLEHGNTNGSSFLYVGLGIIAGADFHNYEAAFQFGKLGYDLVEKGGWHVFQARTSMAFASFIMPWTGHIRNGRDLLRRAFDSANRIGDLTFAAACCNQLNTNFLAAGDPLADVEREAVNGREFAQKLRFGLVVDIITPQVELIGTLRGTKPTFGSFDDERFDEGRFERHLSEAALALPECCYWIRKLQARFFAEDYGAAIHASSQAQRLLWVSLSYFEMAEYHFYSALSYGASCDSNLRGQSRDYVEALKAHHGQLEVWAKNCPENFENRAALVGAEFARIEGRDVDAMRLYELAIRSARENGFAHNEAIAFERASVFYRVRGFDEFADLYIRKARYGYVRWGAVGKVRHLDQMYSHLREEGSSLMTTGTIAAPVEQLDLATVFKFSQAVSGEIVLEKLIDTLLRTAIEQAGAGRGLLIVPRGAELRIQAEANVDGSSVTVGLSDAPIRGDELPESVVQYAARTQESVILDEASARGAFSNDKYIQDKRARSILCIPLVKQGNLIGVLYLENNLAARVFTPGRIAVLNVLASAAAVSLENSRLYRDLQEREAKIRRLIDASIIGIFTWDIEGQILDANDAFLRILGYGRDDLEEGHMRWTDLTPPEWAEIDQRRWAPELKASKSLPPFEKEYFRKDGSRVPVLIGLANFEESPNQGVAFVLDLTERKRAEEAVRQSEKQLRDVIETIPTVAWTALPEGSVDFINRHWEEHTGLSTEAATDLGWQAVIHPEDSKRNAEKWGASVANGEPFENEVRFRRSDGEYRWFMMRAVPMRDGRGKILKWYGITTDIEDRKRAEQLQLDLAHMNRVTTLGELAASISHELKQPIAAAITNASAGLRWLRRDQPDVEEASEAIERIVKDGTRAAEIIDRLRSLYKKSPPQRESLNLKEVVREMAVLLRSEANRDAVSIRTDFAADLPTITADRVQLQQVLMNLMLNGIEAMKETGGVLTVRGRTGQDGQLLVSVSDVGVGLPEEMTDQIFNAFFTTKPQGSGMGLAISRSIIESHGGRLWATANDARGATFTFTLLTEAPGSVDSTASYES